MSATSVQIAFLIPLAIIIAYYDVRYRRIPNPFVLATFLSGVVINAVFGGLSGVFASFAGCLLAFVLMFLLHVFGAMGAGDVKLFAAIGAVIAIPLPFVGPILGALVGGGIGYFTADQRR